MRLARLLLIATSLFLLSPTHSARAQQAPAVGVPGRGREITNGRRIPKEGDLCTGLGFRLHTDFSGPQPKIDGLPVVVGVAAGSPAEAAGLAPGDTLVRVGKKAADEQEALKFDSIGVAVPILIHRNGEAKQLSFVPGRLARRGPNDINYSSASGSMPPGEFKCAVVPPKSQ